MDVALHRCGVTFVLDRAGVTGDDGASHNGMWDMSILQVVPGLRLAAPRDSTRLREDRKSTRLNSSHANISYAVFCLKKLTYSLYQMWDTVTRAQGRRAESE